VAGLLILVALALSGCMGPDPIVSVPPTGTPDLPPPTVPRPPTSQPRPEALDFPLPPPAHVGLERPTDQSCVDCHTDEKALETSIEVEKEGQVFISSGEAWASELPPMEAWEKVFIEKWRFVETLHGRYSCISCHGGSGEASLKEIAHEGMITKPSEEGVCGKCHAEEVAADPANLHGNQAGFQSVLLARSSPDKTSQLETMLGNHCEPCHTTTCGQCHVSRPERTGGGLVAGHLFESTRAMNLTCAGCHGSRIENEYQGHNGSVPGDVHWVQGRMLCSDCHGVAEFHGTGESIHRYDGRPEPSCQARDCHDDVSENDGIEQHGDSHLKALSCQVCHSTTYNNCYNCHVGMEDGTASFGMDAPQLAFKIGRNPIQNRYRPWRYVPVRHVPVTRDSFAYYGKDLLPNFDELPTWKYATPHNIQRITPQTESCNSCHGNAEFFLTTADLVWDERAANRPVVVENVPDAIE